MKRSILTCVVLVLILLTAWPGRDAIAVSDAPERLDTMAKISELTLLMRKMEGHMTRIRSRLEMGKTLNDSANYDPNGIFTEPASPHVKRDEQYRQLGKEFLKNYHRLIAEKNPDTAKVIYAQTINSCLSCHGSYCPGPMMRISKLHVRNR